MIATASAYLHECQSTAQDAYSSCLPNTGPSVPVIVLVLLGVAFVMIGCAGLLLTRADEDRERATEAARRGHVL